MKKPQITFHYLTPVEDVLQAFIDKGSKTSPRVAMEMCRGIVEHMVKDRAAALIMPELINAYDMTVFNTGINPLIEQGDKLEVWTDAMDDAIEALLDSYSLSITQDFIGRYCVSTRFHREAVPGAKSEAQVLAEAFAADVWRVLIHDPDEDAEPPRILSTAKILSAVGIVQDTLKEVMGDMPDKASPQQKEVPMIDVNEVIDTVTSHIGLSGMEDDDVKAFLDMAMDSDDGLALSGLVPLGLDMDAAPVLRMFHAKYGNDASSVLLEAIKHGPEEIDTGTAVGDEFPNGEDEETDPEMRELLGLPPLPVAAPVAAPPAPPKPPGAPPAPAMPKAPPAPPVPVPAAGGSPGVIPKEVFALIRQHVKVKDEDIASGIGVSRQTFINYADPKKSATLVASDEQRAFLMQTIETAMQGLLDARNLLDGNG